MTASTKRAAIYGVLVLVAFLGAGLALASKQSDHSDRGIERKVEFFEVRPDDLAAVEEWALLRCRGNSVEKLAAAHDIEPTLTAVTAFMTRGLPDDSRALVERVCREELK